MHRKNGFTLLETVVTGVALCIIFLGIISFQTNILSQLFSFQNRLRAITLANSQLEELMADPSIVGDGWLVTGDHNAPTPNTSAIMNVFNVNAGNNIFAVSYHVDYVTGYVWPRANFYRIAVTCTYGGPGAIQLIGYKMEW